MTLQEKQRLLALAERLEIVAALCERTAICGLPGHFTSRDAWQGEGTYLRGEAENLRAMAEEAPEPDLPPPVTVRP